MAIQDKFNKPNVIYKITKDIDLDGGTLTIPVGCTLDFQGGSFTNGTIVGNNTKIKAGLQKIFNMNITLNGTWAVPESYPEWFKSIQKALDNFEVVRLSKGTYEIETPLNISSGKTLIGSGALDTTIQSIVGVNCINIQEDARRVTISNMRIDGTSISNNIGIYCDPDTGGSDHNYNNLVIANFKNGIKVKEVWWNNTLSEVRFNSCEVGFNGWESNLGQNIDNLFSKVYSNGHTVSGIDLSAFRNTTLINCNFGTTTDLNSPTTFLRIAVNSYGINIISCNFEGCSTTSNNGAILVYSRSIVSFIGCRFHNIQSTDSLGHCLKVLDNAIVDLKSCIFENNKAIPVYINNETASIIYSRCYGITVPPTNYHRCIDLDKKLYNLDLNYFQKFGTEDNVVSSKRVVTGVNRYPETVQLTVVGDVPLIATASVIETSGNFTINLFKPNGTPNDTAVSVKWFITYNKPLSPLY